MIYDEDDYTDDKPHPEQEAIYPVGKHVRKRAIQKKTERGRRKANYIGRTRGGSNRRHARHWR